MLVPHSLCVNINLLFIWGFSLFSRFVCSLVLFGFHMSFGILGVGLVFPFVFLSFCVSNSHFWFILSQCVSAVPIYSSLPCVFILCAPNLCQFPCSVWLDSVHFSSFQSHSVFPWLYVPEFCSCFAARVLSCEFLFVPDNMEITTEHYFMHYMPFPVCDKHTQFPAKIDGKICWCWYWHQSNFVRYSSSPAQA